MAYRPYIWRKENPEKRTEQKRREKVRAALRQKGILPQTGESMTEQQQIIYDQIGNNDFSYWDTLKRKRELPNNGGKDKQMHIPKKSPEYLLWYRNYWKAKESNIPFNIEVEDIVIPTHCEETNMEILTDTKDKNKKNYYTLDRIIWGDGFIKDNVRVISVEGLSNKLKKLSPEGLFYNTPRNYTPNDKQKEIYDRAKKNAKKRNLDFNLKKEDIIIPTICPYLGIELLYNKQENQLNNYYSIDRIDSSKGYVKENIQIISLLANTMKNNATTEQLITFSQNILKIHNPRF